MGRGRKETLKMEKANIKSQGNNMHSASEHETKPKKSKRIFEGLRKMFGFKKNKVGPVSHSTQEELKIGTKDKWYNQYGSRIDGCSNNGSSLSPAVFQNKTFPPEANPRLYSYEEKSKTQAHEKQEKLIRGNQIEAAFCTTLRKKPAKIHINTPTDPSKYHAESSVDNNLTKDVNTLAQRNPISYHNDERIGFASSHVAENDKVIDDIKKEVSKIVTEQPHKKNFPDHGSSVDFCAKHELQTKSRVVTVQPQSKVTLVSAKIVLEIAEQETCCGCRPGFQERCLEKILTMCEMTEISPATQSFSSSDVDMFSDLADIALEKESANDCVMNDDVEPMVLDDISETRSQSGSKAIDFLTVGIKNMDIGASENPSMQGHLTEEMNTETFEKEDCNPMNESVVQDVVDEDWNHLDLDDLMEQNNEEVYHRNFPDENESFDSGIVEEREEESSDVEEKERTEEKRGAEVEEGKTLELKLLENSTEEQDVSEQSKDGFTEDEGTVSHEDNTTDGEEEFGNVEESKTFLPKANIKEGNNKELDDRETKEVNESASDNEDLAKSSGTEKQSRIVHNQSITQTELEAVKSTKLEQKKERRTLLKNTPKQPRSNSTSLGVENAKESKKNTEKKKIREKHVTFDNEESDKSEEKIQKDYEQKELITKEKRKKRKGKNEKGMNKRAKFKNRKEPEKENAEQSVLDQNPGPSGLQQHNRNRSIDSSSDDEETNAKKTRDQKMTLENEQQYRRIDQDEFARKQQQRQQADAHQGLPRHSSPRKTKKRRGRHRRHPYYPFKQSMDCVTSMFSAFILTWTGFYFLLEKNQENISQLSQLQRPSVCNKFYGRVTAKTIGGAFTENSHGEHCNIASH